MTTRLQNLLSILVCAATPWMADGVTIGDGSVQASLEAVILKCLRADGAKLNSAGGALMTST
jgi:hypothetical protein